MDQLGAVSWIGFVVGVVIWLVVVPIGLQRIFVALGESPNRAWVPFVNLATVYRLGGFSEFWVIALVIPVVDIAGAIVLFVASHRVNRRLGKSGWFTVLAVVLWWAWTLAAGLSLTRRQSTDGWVSARPHEPLQWSDQPRPATPLAWSLADDASASPAPRAAVQHAAASTPERPMDYIPRMPAALRADQDEHLDDDAIDDPLPAGWQPEPALPAGAPAATPWGAFRPAAADGPDGRSPERESSERESPERESSERRGSHRAGPDRAASSSSWSVERAAPVEPAESAGAFGAAGLVGPAGFSGPAAAEASLADAETVLRPTFATHSPDDDATVITGMRLPEPDSEETVVSPRRRPRWWLETGMGTRVELTGTSAILGRKPVVHPLYPGAQQIVVTDDARSVSATHAVLEYVDGDWQVTDLDSTNGVWLVDPETGDETELGARNRAVATPQIMLGELSIRVVQGG